MLLFIIIVVQLCTNHAKVSYHPGHIHHGDSPVIISWHDIKYCYCTIIIVIAM
jgi:hypothetical protein